MKETLGTARSASSVSSKRSRLRIRRAGDKVGGWFECASCSGDAVVVGLTREGDFVFGGGCSSWRARKFWEALRSG